MAFVAQHSGKEVRFRILAITICPDRIAVISEEDRSRRECVVERSEMEDGRGLPVSKV